MKYRKIVTDAGVDFTINQAQITMIAPEMKQGKLTGYINIYKAGQGHDKTPELHAQVLTDKIDTFYFT